MNQLLSYSCSYACSNFFPHTSLFQLYAHTTMLLWITSYLLHATVLSLRNDSIWSFCCVSLVHLVGSSGSFSWCSVLISSSQAHEHNKPSIMPFNMHVRLPTTRNASFSPVSFTFTETMVSSKCFTLSVQGMGNTSPLACYPYWVNLTRWESLWLSNLIHYTNQCLVLC